MWLSAGVNPRWRQVLGTLTAGRGVELVDVPLVEGVTDWAQTGSVGAAPAAVVVASPNYFGCIDPLAPARAVATSTGALLVAAFDPVAAGLLRAPGQQGADVAIAEGQPMGTPLAFGGPDPGMFAVASDHVRRLPGRLVGRTVDALGRPAYVTTLRTREQDIRRERASSNICSNQTLVAVAAMVQLAWLGTGGLRELALRCARGAATCARRSCHWTACSRWWRPQWSASSLSSSPGARSRRRAHGGRGLPGGPTGHYGR